MSVIRLQEMTPQIYTEESRDFQLLSRLYDSVFNGLKFDTDSILDLIDTKECRTSVLQLLQTKLGFFTERKIDDEKLRSILECFPILVRNKGSLRAIKETLYLFLRMYSVSSNMEIYYLPTPYSPPFSEEEPCVLASGKLPENNSLVIRIHSFETKPDTSVMEEIFRYILPAGINYYIEFDKSATLQDIVLKSEDSAELTFVSDNINSQLRSSDQTEPYNIGTVNTSSLISTDSYVSNRFIGYYGDEQSASDYLATLVDKIYSTAVINYSATGEVSGPIVSISDAEAGAPVEALSVAVEPVQDLHGYDNPWPAGGGKNKLPYPYAMTSQEINGVVFTVNLDGSVKAKGQATANATFYLMNKASNFDATVFNGMVLNGSTGGTQSTYFIRITDLVNWSTSSYTGDASIDSLTNTGRCAVFISVQSGTDIDTTFYPMIRPSGTDATFAPYSNLCPISGFTGLNVYKTGKNLLALPIVPYNQLFGDFDATKWFWLKAGTYTLSYKTEQGSRYFVKLADMDGNMLSDNKYKPNVDTYYNAGYEGWIRGSDVSGTVSVILAIVEDCYVRIGRSYTNPDTIIFSDCQLELTNTASSYSPYVGTTLPIPLGQTVYGCVVDAVNGKAVVTHKIQNMASLQWYYTATWNGAPAFYSTQFSECATVTDNTVNTLCSTYEAVSGDALWTGKTRTSIIALPSSRRFYVRDNRFDNVPDFVTALTGQTAIIPLAEPFEITLTPTQVELLQGENNLWSNAGDISITYKRDSTYKAMICTAYSSNTPTWHRINFLGNLTTEEVSTQGGIVAALQAKGITVNNGDLIKYNNLYLLRVNNDWQECNYARYILNTYHLTE